MFKKILVPTDGSEASQAAALDGVKYAGQCKAEAIAVYVVPEYLYPGHSAGKDYQSDMKNSADEFFRPLQTAAEAGGAKFTSEVLFSNSVPEVIASAARRHGCDLIFMGSRGRTGLSQLLLGSVTAKVLHLTDIPVLVHNIKK